MKRIILNELLDLVIASLSGNVPRKKSGNDDFG
jgi:hypothetical protein